jgi:diketogulonate reductase-like aldo/keto reductase
VVWLCRYVDAALYLTELQSDGVLGAVGVTNFDVPRLEAMINKGAQLVSNQVGLLGRDHAGEANAAYSTLCVRQLSTHKTKPPTARHSHF